MRITVLHSDVAQDASLDEQETLEQVVIISDTLESLEHDVAQLPFTTDFPALTRQLAAQSPQLVFNLVESVDGKCDDIYLAPFILQHLKIPYTGSNANNLLLTTNKLTAKKWLQAGGLPTADWLTEEAIAYCVFLDAPYILKSICEEGSVGIYQDSVVDDVATLKNILSARKKTHGGEWFAERYIAGREFNAAFIAAKDYVDIFAIAEITFQNIAPTVLPIVDYIAKWHVNTPTYEAIDQCLIPAKEDDQLLEKMANIIRSACRWFHLDGYFRMDMRVDDAGNIWILEINANPSLAPDAGFAAQAEHAGMTYPDLLERFIVNALETRYAI